MIPSAPELAAVTPVGQLPAIPWRNGGGETRGIAASAPRPAAEPAWRISIATVRDGAVFSFFPEYERIFLPLEPETITLIATQGELRPCPDGASRFSGGDAVTASVPGGEALALNVMARPDLAAPVLRRRTVHGSYANTDAMVRAGVLVRGSVTATDGDTVSAPAVLTAGTEVQAIEAEIVEVVLDDAASQDGEGAA